MKYYICFFSLSKIISFYYCLFSYLVPPHVTNKKVDLVWTNSSKDIELVCKVDCANPDNITYSWYNFDENPNTPLYQSIYSNTYKLVLSQQTTNKVVIFCEAVNEVNNKIVDDNSRTIFEITYQKDDGKYNSYIKFIN